MTDYWSLFTAATITVQMKCLAQVVYREARGEAPIGQIAVAWVVKNRVHHSRWPTTYCKVARQKWQFAWGGKISDQAAFREALYYSWRVVNGTISDPTEGSTHFLAKDLLQSLPSWVDQYETFAVLGGHTFYR